MIKRLDRLVLGAFLGPFVLTFAVVTFILLTKYMLNYFEDFVGKDLGWQVFAQLLFYFSINMMPVALPLAVLLSSLIAFGNMGEFNELTAVKSSGVTLMRVIRPVFLFVVALSIGLFIFNDVVVPRANLEAFSLLYDIRQKKPTLDIRPGVFYNGLPGYSVKVNHKEPDGRTLSGIMIYDHTASRGNTTLIVADSGHMYTMLNERYLVLDLFRGQTHAELIDNDPRARELVRSRFNNTRLVFSLASFDLANTKKELFAQNKVMRNLEQLELDADSILRDRNNMLRTMPPAVEGYFVYQFKPRPIVVSIPADSAHVRRLIPVGQSGQGGPLTDVYMGAEAPAPQSGPMAVRIGGRKRARPLAGVKEASPVQAAVVPDIRPATSSDSLRREAVRLALNQARSIRLYTQGFADRSRELMKEFRIWSVERVRRYSLSVSCLVLFLIGAPLGAIIRKGGLGIPVIVSIIFFIIYYILTTLGEKWAKEGVYDLYPSMWYANAILAIIGLFFLNQARVDAALFEFDYYRQRWRRGRRRLTRSGR